MIIKNVGQILLFKLKLFKIGAKISSLIIISSFALFILIIDMKDKLNFQQPSLTTQVKDLVKINKKQQLIISNQFNIIDYHIQQYFIEGILHHQSLLVTLSSNTNLTFCSKIIKTFQQDKYLSKNIIFIKYQTIEQLNKIMEEPPFYWGIIRAAISLDLTQNGNKLFYKIYGKNGDHPDIDYYNAIKQLMDNLAINWTPCQSILKFKPFKFIRQYFKNMFCDQTLCQLYENLSNKKTPHSILQNLGIQSATLKTVQLKSSSSSGKSSQSIQIQKLQLLVHSFLKQFSLQQDHLHSAETLFIPADNYHVVGVVKYMLPSLLLILGVLAFGINKYWFEQKQKIYQVTNFDAILGLFLSWEWYFTKTIHYGWILIPLRLLLGSKAIATQKLIFLAIQSILSFYLSIFNFSYGILSMIAASMMHFLPQKFLIIITVISITFNFIDNWQFTIQGQFSLFFLPFILSTFSRMYTKQLKFKQTEQKNQKQD